MERNVCNMNGSKIEDEKPKVPFETLPSSTASIASVKHENNFVKLYTYIAKSLLLQIPVISLKLVAMNTFFDNTALILPAKQYCEMKDRYNLKA